MQYTQDYIDMPFDTSTPIPYWDMLIALANILNRRFLLL